MEVKDGVKSLIGLAEGNERELGGLDKTWSDLEDSLSGSMENCPVFEITDSIDKKNARDLWGNVHVNKYDDRYVMTSSEFWSQLMSWTMNENYYVEFSCWKDEEDILNELRDRIKDCEIKTSNDGDQIWIKSGLTNDVKDLILKDYLNNDGRIKWFELNLVSDDKGIKPLYISQYGTIIDILRMLPEEGEFIENLFGIDCFSVKLINFNSYAM